VPSAEDGVASDTTTVPFVPVDPDGIMSIVVHEHETETTFGSAGPREACFPVRVPQWIPDTV
jgi:hypothetical protein